MQLLKVFFGLTAQDMIKAEGKTIAEVAAKVPGTPASQFTRWRRGDWGYIDADKLVRLVRAITSDPQKQAELIAAYLRDMTPREFHLTVIPEIRNPSSDQKTDLTGPWASSIRAKLERIGHCYSKDEDFQRMVDTLDSWATRMVSKE
ncbi:MAG: hypothetical protein QM790_17545 [Nibricoccus sp.]